MTEPIDTPHFLQAMLERGWRWSEGEANLMVHPDDHDLGIRYDPLTNKLTVSPKLEEHLKLVIPTPASKSKTFR